jgi:hypothetical protein
VADWDPPLHDLNFASMDLHSPSEPEAGRREIRAPDRGVVSCLAAAEAAACSPDAVREQASSAELSQEPNA